MTTKYLKLGNSSVLAIMAAMAVAACASGSVQDESAANAADELGGEGQTNWWKHEREARQTAVDAYIESNRADFDTFRRGPAGNTGVPMIVFRLLPELFPEIWGPPSENLSRLGFVSDSFEPTRVLPLGLGYSGMEPAIPTPFGAVKLNAVQVTCMSCHTGRVKDETGAIRTLVGAPNTELQYNRYRAFIAATVNNPGYVASRFTAALATKTPGWLYNDPSMLLQEKLETAIFMGNPTAVLTGLKDGVNAASMRIKLTVGATTYARPDAPELTGATPGHIDVMAGFASLVTDPAKFATRAELAAVLPPLPAMTDNQPVWRQADRSATKWGGEIPDYTHSNAGAAMGMAGSPKAVSMVTVNAATRFTSQLPAPPYPFDVERSAMVRGEKLYNRYCASCHAAGNDNYMTPTEIGTDPNRSNVLTPYTRALLSAATSAACSDPATCTKDGVPLKSEEVLRITKKYAAVPLAGIWARAPYLHNGSVPTLRALLTGERPAQFYRGNTSYDTKDVGFAYKEAETPNAKVYDTTRAGNSNIGHLGSAVGPDWSKAAPRDVDDLLEYLKTL